MITSSSQESQATANQATGSNEKPLEEVDMLNNLLSEHTLRLNDVLNEITQAGFLGRAFYISTFIPITLCVIYSWTKHLFSSNKYVTDYSLPSPWVLFIFAVITLLSLMIFYLLKIKAGEIAIKAAGLREHLKTLSVRGKELMEYNVNRNLLDYTRRSELEFNISEAEKVIRAFSVHYKSFPANSGKLKHASTENIKEYENIPTADK